MTNDAVYNKTLSKPLKNIFNAIDAEKSSILRTTCYCLLSAMCALLIGCSTTQAPVSVVDRAKNPSPEFNKSADDNALSNQVYTIQKGDTLYGIALNHGIEYKKILELNNIRDPNSIRPGQKINLSLPAPAGDDSKPSLYAIPQQPTTTTIEPAQPLGSLPPPAATITGATSDAASLSSGKIKTEPKALKLPFAEQNTARIPQSSSSPSTETQAPPTKVVINEKAKIEDASQYTPAMPNQTGNQSKADWIWPTNGKVVSAFSKNSKGVKISGQAGQAVLASAAGVVVYSGNGLRGYGNLIIIKHDDTFLSAYAHNNKLLVKESEAVTKGQKIAEMGNTDTDTVQLHFEIRKNSKPVDPLEYLSH